MPRGTPKSISVWGFWYFGIVNNGQTDSLQTCTIQRPVELPCRVTEAGAYASLASSRSLHTLCCAVLICTTETGVPQHSGTFYVHDEGKTIKEQGPRAGLG